MKEKILEKVEKIEDMTKLLQQAIEDENKVVQKVTLNEIKDLSTEIEFMLEDLN